MAPHSACLLEEAGVEGRLSAAGLALGVDHLYPKPPEYAYHAYADLGIDLVHIARYEKGCSQRTPLPADLQGQYSNRMSQRSGAHVEERDIVMPVEARSLNVAMIAMVSGRVAP